MQNMTRTTTFPSIWFAIGQLLQIKEAITYTEVATAAGVKKPKCLEVIVKNKHLLKIDKKGRITGVLTDKQYIIKKARWAFGRGELFVLEGVNYGTDNELRVPKEYEDKIKDLRTPYCVGGLGDNYMTEYVLDTPKNREELVKRGFTYWDDYVAKLKAEGDNVLHAWWEP
jgi:hypothetical protein